MKSNTIFYEEQQYDRGDHDDQNAAQSNGQGFTEIYVWGSKIKISFIFK